MRKLSLPLLSVAAALAVSPALAHDEHEHGLPGAAHPFSADHLGWLLLAAVALMAFVTLRKPILRAIRARSRR